jgi:addiction module HigA family antidote
MMMSDRLKMKNPTHPGAFVKLMVLEPLGLTVTEAANALGVTRPALSNLVNANASLSSEMAIRLDKAFGVDMETLMRMQNAFDIAQAKQRADEIDVAPYLGR